MFLSFIVPVYNTEKYLAECLDSLLEQDIPHNDYEIICVNDGSTDSSRRILQEYSERYPNIVIVDKENGGLSSARNAGYSFANGDYIWFVDSDDLIQENTLHILKTILAEQHYNRLQIGTYIFNTTLTENERLLSQKHELKVNSHYYDSVVWGSLFERDFLLKNNCRFHYTDITHGEDTVFMYEFISHSPSTRVYDEPLYFYRIRPGSLQTARSESVKIKQTMSYLRIVAVMQNHFEKATPANKKAAANVLMTYLWYTLHGAAKTNRKNRVFIMASLKQLKLYPYHRPKACTLIKSYQTSRTDIVGKLFDKVYINMHRPWGFWSMVLLERLIKAKAYVRNLLKGVKA